MSGIFCARQQEYRLLEVPGEGPRIGDKFSLHVDLACDGVRRILNRYRYERHIVRRRCAGVRCILVCRHVHGNTVTDVRSLTSSHGFQSGAKMVCVCRNVVQIVYDGVLVRLHALCADIALNVTSFDVGVQV